MESFQIFIIIYPLDIEGVDYLKDFTQFHLTVPIHDISIFEIQFLQDIEKACVFDIERLYCSHFILSLKKY